MGTIVEAAEDETETEVPTALIVRRALKLSFESAADRLLPSICTDAACRACRPHDGNTYRLLRQSAGPDCLC